MGKPYSQDLRERVIAAVDTGTDRKFKLAHRALHAKQQPIVGMARIVDSVLVDDKRADQSTELDQRVPVAAITGKTRRLDREHSADTAVAPPSSIRSSMAIMSFAPTSNTPS